MGETTSSDGTSQRVLKQTTFLPVMSASEMLSRKQGRRVAGAILTRTIHEYLLRRPILSPGEVFSFGLLDGLPVRLRRPYVREAPAGFGLERLATAFSRVEHGR